MRVINHQGLKAKGIPFSRSHIRRLVSLNEFPAPIRIGLNTNSWIEEEVDAYIAERAARRDTPRPRRRGRHGAAS